MTPRQNKKPQSKSNSPSVRERGFSTRTIAALRRKLLAHFDAHRREVPWRADTDPYRVWVSEIMLQQTRVETVRPYYDRWMQRFPNVQKLAEAPLDDVLKSWEGLGYYSRARNLHSASRIVCERHNGELPDHAEGLRALPGIGEYTAGAVASIAFHAREPVVDGNVKRVLHRLLDAPRLSGAALRALATELVPEDRPGDFNQALMELGALICTPRAPRCTACPVRQHCAAFAERTQLDRPAPGKPSRIPDRYFNTVVLIDANDRVMLRKRPLTGLLGGLWEFPATEGDARRLARELTGASTEFTLAGTVTHTFSHFRAFYVVHAARLRGRGKAPRDSALRWVSIDDLAGFALPVAQRKVVVSVSYLSLWPSDRCCPFYPVSTQGC
jgi:A/G-specific adenine glycosylase